MKSTEEMVRLNHEQSKFYDSIHQAEAQENQGGYAKNQSANALTRAWATLRYQQQAAVKSAGVETTMKEAHKRWVMSKSGGDFLEFGCFSGSPSTFLLAENAGSYVGVELSPLAVKALNRKFEEKGLSRKAVAEAVDFLTLDEHRKFDLFYAHGVLHHFENAEALFKKLAALAKPDAVLLFVEPSAVNPGYRILRALYRPFQSDALWEWPFRRRTVEALEKYFEVVEGFGWGRRSLPLSILTGLPVIGKMLTGIYVRMAQAEVKQGWHAKGLAQFDGNGFVSIKEWMNPYRIIRLKKALYSLTHPRCWNALRMRVIPAIEHRPALAAADCDVIIDVGANRGQFSLISRMVKPTVPIIAFEPVPSEAAIFRKALNAENVQLHQVALGEESGEAEIHLSGSVDSSSLLPIGERQKEIFPFTDEIGTMKVPVKRLDDFKSEWEKHGRILLKIDVQGFELSVLKGSLETLKACPFVYVECSEIELYTGQALYPDVANFLIQYGFKLQSRHNEIRVDGRLVLVDCLFVRI